MSPERFEHTAEQTRKMLASLWERSLPVLRDRVAELDQAAAHAQDGTLTAEEREEACGTAHKLSGSLGMFGYPKGTEAARKLEQMLEGNTPLNAQELAKHIAELRDAAPI